MTSRSIQYEMSARETVSQTMNQIAGAVQNLGNVSASQIPRLARELANAQTATTRAATAIEQYRTATAHAATAEAQAAAAAVHYQTALRGLHGQAQQTSGALSRIAETAAGFVSGQAILGAVQAVGGGVIDLAGNALTLAGNLKQSKIAFEQMLGSASAADAELKAIRQYATDTAFQFPQLEKATTGFIGVGKSGKEALQTVKDIGDEVAGRGKEPEALDRIALAMEQIRSKSRLMGDDAMQLLESGIPVWRILGDYLKVDSAAAQELSEQGKITADTWEKAFHADAVTNFGGAAAKASQTFNGLLSTAKDLGDTILATLGGPIIDDLEPKIKGALDAMSDPRVLEAVRGWGREIAHVIDQVWELGLGIAKAFGLELPKAAGNIKQAADETQALDAHWNTISVSVGNVKEQTQALKDSEDGIRARAEATSRSYDLRIQKLRDAGTALERQWSYEDKIYKLHHLDADLTRANQLKVNIFTDTGRAAALEAQRLEEQKAETIRDMGREKMKNANADAITGLERRKQAAAQAAQDEIRGVEARIKNIEREAQAYDEYNRAKIAAIEEYKRKQEESRRAITRASDEYRAFYDSTYKGLNSIASGDMITGPGAPANGLFLKLFGTPDEQAALAGSLARNLINGITKGIESYDWATWWDKALNDSAINFFGDLGVRAGRAFRQGLGLDGPANESAEDRWKRLVSGGGTNEERKNALGPDAAHNPLDIFGSYLNIPQILKDDWDATVRALGGQSSPQAPPSPPVRMPGAGGPEGSTRPTRTVSEVRGIHVTVGVDQQNGNLTAAVKNIIRGSAQEVDAALYNAYS